MKIAMILDNPFVEGKPYPKRVYYEAKSLVDNGHDVTIYCKNEKDMDIPKFEIRDGIKINRCFDYFLGTTVLADKYLTAHFDLMNAIKEKYDVYHCHDVFTWPIGYILSQRDNAKFICDSHEYFPDYINKEWYPSALKYNITKILVNARGDYIRYSDKVIVVSKETGEELHKDFKLKEMPTVIYNTRPLRYSYIQEDSNKANYFREYYNINDNTKILLFQGLVEDVRGLDIAIKIIAHLDNCILIIAGESRGNYINELKKLAQEINVEHKVIFTGFMPSEKLFEYSKYADFLIYFGKNKVKNMELTIPNKFFDYIMATKPIIASDLKPLTRMINEHKIGIVVDTENITISMLAKEIKSYINNKKLIELAKENAKKIQWEYSWERQEEKLLSLYKDLE